MELPALLSLWKSSGQFTKSAVEAMDKRRITQEHFDAVAGNACHFVVGTIRHRLPRNGPVSHSTMKPDVANALLIALSNHAQCLTGRYHDVGCIDRFWKVFEVGGDLEVFGCLELWVDTDHLVTSLLEVMAQGSAEVGGIVGQAYERESSLAEEVVDRFA